MSSHCHLSTSSSSIHQWLFSTPAFVPNSLQFQSHPNLFLSNKILPLNSQHWTLLFLYYAIVRRRYTSTSYYLDNSFFFLNITCIFIFFHGALKFRAAYLLYVNQSRKRVFLHSYLLHLSLLPTLLLLLR